VLTSAGATSELLASQIRFDAPEEIHEGLAALGRTEDVRFSPSGRRLAFACYELGRIAVAEVTISRSSAGVDIAVTSLAHCESVRLQEPHGLDFVDEQTVVVGTRAGEIVVLRVPHAGTDGTATRIGSLVSGFGAPGSVAVRPLTTDGYELLAVHNWANAITRYQLAADGTLSRGDVVARRWLDLPDGLAVSSDHRWLAVSNHNTHDVLVFDRARLHADADPVGVLRGVGYPHGLRFGLGDRLLLVADAGAPYVDVFERAEASWATASYPLTSIRVMDDETFAEGHRNPREGGPKGLDIDTRTNVLALTAETVPIAFFDLEVAFERNETRHDRVGYELERLRDLERHRMAASDAVAQLSAVLDTKAWRLTGPLRSAYGLRTRLRRRSR
jgi:hypothetical protein